MSMNRVGLFSSSIASKGSLSSTLFQMNNNNNNKPLFVRMASSHSNTHNKDSHHHDEHHDDHHGHGHNEPGGYFLALPNVKIP
jgi:hypothetical protein